MDVESLAAFDSQVQGLVQQIAHRLRSAGERLALAESCTAGLISGSLAAVPGASHWLCGSLVVYRAECKQAWLGVDPELLARYTAVSIETSSAMALGALQRTPTAHWSLAITGHVGPNAPPEQDGWIHVAIARRLDREERDDAAPGVGAIRVARSHHVSALRRRPRQFAAVLYAVRLLADVLAGRPAGGIDL